MAARSAVTPRASPPPPPPAKAAAAPTYDDFVDVKGPPPPGGDLPSVESAPPSAVATSSALVAARPVRLTRMPTLKSLDMTIGASYQLAVGSTDHINAMIQNQLLLTVPDFLSAMGIFEEFFVNKFHVDFEPANRYSGSRPSYPPTTFFTQVPLSVVSLHHDAAAYQTHADSVNNGWFKSANSADRWSYEWKNIEKKSSTVALAPQAEEYSTQSWARLTTGLAYSGRVQIISPPGSVFGMGPDDRTGTTSVRWVVSFRSRR